MKKEELREIPKYLAKYQSNCKILYCRLYIAQATLKEEGYNQEEIYKIISREDKEEGLQEILDRIQAQKYYEKGDILIILTTITNNPEKYLNFLQ